MRVQLTDNITFGILKYAKAKPYGEYLEGTYKGYNIEIYDAYKYNQLLIYVSDKFRNFIKSKLIYWQDGAKKVTRAEGKRYDRMV